jgi:hypothetical protein
MKYLRTFLNRRNAAILLVKIPDWEKWSNPNSIDLWGQREKLINAAYRSQCLPKWSDEICAKSKKVLRQWILDFEWTRNQHELGVKFASDHCQPSNVEPADLSCDALQNYKKRNGLN